MSEIEVKHSDNSFFVELEGERAKITYKKISPQIIDFQHTEVPERFRGKGIAEKMAKTALEYTRENNMKARASCRFVSSFIKRHNEYEDLLEE